MIFGTTLILLGTGMAASGIVVLVRTLWTRETPLVVDGLAVLILGLASVAAGLALL